MAYAINRNGTIQVYQSVPKSFEGSQKEYLGGFDQLTRAQQKAEGLFDVVMPSGYDSQIHDLGDIFGILQIHSLLIQRQIKLGVKH